MTTTIRFNRQMKRWFARVYSGDSPDSNLPSDFERHAWFETRAEAVAWLDDQTAN